jgi:hypothetical protein
VKVNDKLYMAAWLWHWHLNEIKGEVPGFIRSEARKAFPYAVASASSIRFQGVARKLHKSLKDSPPKVSYETPD